MKTAEDKLNHAIIEFYEKLSSWEHSVVRNKGVSLAQVHTAEILGVHGPMRMKELANKIGVTTGTLTVQIDKMVQAGLVVRQPHESDRRSILVALTDSGMALFHEHDELHLQLTRDITSSFSEEQRELLLACFSQMNSEF